MSTVHALLTMLQDRSKRTPASVRHLLLELASCCRCEDAKASILADGLAPLLALATEDQELPHGEALEVLLELLVLLVLDDSQAKTKAARGGALELAVRCLHELSTGAGGRRRTKLLKRALELVDLLSHTTEAKQKNLQTIILKQLLKMVKRTEEEVSVLMRATDTLGRFVDGSLERIQVAANEGAIAVLIKLLRLYGETADLKRTACEVLMRLAEAPGMLQIMATHNVVSALCICLRVEKPGCQLEFGVIRLLSRLTQEARVHGQIVHEEMIPLLFRAIERNNNVKEVIAITCSIIADLSDFAQECKLDLAPFVEGCKGNVLVLAASCHAQEANIVDSTFRFFVNVSNNPVDLPQLINSETVEGLLSLFVLAGGSGYLAELAGHLVHVISRLSRSTLEKFTIQEEDITLPALFLCLRNYHEDIRFTSQVFAIMSKHWNRQYQNKSVHSITGYVSIAIEVLCKIISSSKSWGDQTADIINFVREILLSKDGPDIVLSCGGKDLLEMLHTHLPTREDNAFAPDNNVSTEANSSSIGAETDGVSSVASTSISPIPDSALTGEKLASVVVTMLEKAVLGLADQGLICNSSPSEPSNKDLQLQMSLRGTAERLGDAEYDDYVSRILHLELSCHFKPIRNGISKSVNNTKSRTTSAQLCTAEVCDSGAAQESNCSSLDEPIEHDVCEENESCGSIVPADSSGDEATNEDAENVEGENNDDSDDDDGEEIENVKSGGSIKEERLPSFISFSDPLALEQRNSITNQTSSRASTARFYDHLEDRKWYYIDKAQVKYPKHPSRNTQEDQNNPEPEFVLEEPEVLEPCNLSDAETSTQFVIDAVVRRTEFVARDVNSRARIVYENTVVEDSDEKVGIPPFMLNSCAPLQDPPYFVPERTKAFCDLGSGLTFDSNFESGNLGRAIRIGEYEYDLVLRHDFNSSGQMQWFYFAVSNIHLPSASPRSGQKYRFNIVNLCKPNSLFNQGLQPVVYSVRDAHQKGHGWLRSGTDIYYFANLFTRPPRNAASFPSIEPTENVLSITAATSTAPVMTYYTLTFTLEFWNADDTYLIAHSYPYTLSMHQLHIENILQTGFDVHRILRHSSLCTTVSGRSCDLLTISDFNVAKNELDARKAVFMTSRVHPGESQASWMMRGVIDFLLGNSKVAQILRRMFVFQIIPILNPDGVYYGNSRCGLAACDLNRQWQNPSKALHPTIFHAKELLVKERSSRGVVFYCDIHGHSRKKNVFMYGCDTKRKPNPAARAFVKLFSMQQTAKKYISFSDCSFKVSKDKETTARVVVANELKINWSFTLEASFCGANYGELQNTHFNTKHLREVGASLCETLFQACISNINARDRLVAIVDDATVCIPEKIEPCLREAGVITENTSVDDDANTNHRSSFQKAKTGSNRKIEIAPKSVKKKNSKARAIGTSEAGTSKPVDTNEGPGRRRRLSQQSKSASMVTGLGGVATIDTSASCLDLAYIPPPKLSGRKLRSKFPKVRRTKSSPDGHVKYRRQKILSLASNDDGDESKGTRGQAATADGTSSDWSLNDSIMPPVSSSMLSTVPGPPTTSIRASYSESSYVRSSKSIPFPYPSSILGIQLRDTSALLQSEVMTRSPKAPGNRFRFRGAGRQFAAVNTIPRTTIHDILRSDSVTAFQSYDPDLINASTMVIRQRGSNPTSNNSIGSTDEKNVSPPSSNYLSFPSVI